MISAVSAVITTTHVNDSHGSTLTQNLPHFINLANRSQQRAEGGVVLGFHTKRLRYCRARLSYSTNHINAFADWMVFVGSFDLYP